MRQALKQRLGGLPLRAIGWVGATLVLGSLTAMSVGHLLTVPAQETLRANKQQQRVIVDPVTGLVSGLGTVEEVAPFDVAPEVDPPPAEEPVTDTDTPGAEVPVPDTPQDVPAAEVPAEEPSAPATPPKPTPGATGMQALRLDAPAEKFPLIARGPESLVAAPAPEITEKLGKQSLPKRGENDTGPFKLYAKSFQRTVEKPMLAIVVTDVGFSREVFDQLLALPAEITIGFSPYAAQPAEQIGALRNNGREVWAMLPLMSHRYPQDDPGPLGLISALTTGGANERLHGILAATLGSVGVILPTDEAFTSKINLWNPVRRELHQRGLYMLATDPARSLDALGATKEESEMIRRADIVIDTASSDAAMRSKLAALRREAVAKSKLVVVMAARPQALRILSEWLATEPLGQEVSLAPLSAILAPEAPPPAAPPPEESGGH